jgi:ABC-type polar amino acid transport system ATPase subunit
VGLGPPDRQLLCGLIGVQVVDSPVIRMRGVNKWFGANHVLKDVSLEIAAGEVVVVCGPSGSGKSTLIRCVNRLEAVEAGEITVLGHIMDRSRGRALSEMRSQVGMVFQAFNLYPHLTAIENIVLAPMKVRNMARRDAEALAMDLLSRVGVAEKAHAYPSYLSGGQQQRVAIARALAMKPKILLFDEPTSALDPEMIKEVLDVMVDLARDGMTMMVVTHEMGFARNVAHRILFMDEGRLVEVATPERFFANPESPRARQFLAKILR